MAVRRCDDRIITHSGCCHLKRVVSPLRQRIFIRRSVRTDGRRARRSREDRRRTGSGPAAAHRSVKSRVERAAWPRLRLNNSSRRSAGCIELSPAFTVRRVGPTSDINNAAVARSVASIRIPAVLQVLPTADGATLVDSHQEGHITSFAYLLSSLFSPTHPSSFFPTPFKLKPDRGVGSVVSSGRGSSAKPRPPKDLIPLIRFYWKLTLSRTRDLSEKRGVIDGTRLL